MQTAQVDAAITKMADVAVKSAAEFIRKSGKTATDVQLGAIATALKAGFADCWDQAVRDGREALAAGMQDVAALTFASSFRLLGIQAAKSVLGD